MSRYDALNRELSKAAINGELDEKRKELESKDSSLAEALMNPRSTVVRVGDCSCPEGDSACEAACLFDAIQRDEHNNIVITANCTGCGECLKACSEENLSGRKDSIAVINLLKDRKAPVYAMIAPAFSGQFSREVTSGRLRSAFKYMGFYGMIEVALFADILTLKEALEFDRAIRTDDDFLLTSCCCPLWVALIKKSYKSMIPHVPPSVFPMVACGRSIKRMHPEAKTVFIGPCLAKKAEAKEPDIADAVDIVLTFEEIAELFELMGINPADFEEDQSDHSSRAGRIYARTAGVSEAVQTTLDRLRPGRRITLRSRQADGVANCKALLKEISEGSVNANFIEGMGCVGGCVGGPKSLIDRESARVAVNEYGDTSRIKTPADNPYVLELLRRLGYETVETLLDRDSIYTRNF
ncbi:MAG: [Fe-Fe] hydrogenase large subunit C-terminal domain-containing protein [Christensenellales bacterium]|jgi:iron only hydrogenase large subunit-like protein